MSTAAFLAKTSIQNTEEGTVARRSMLAAILVISNSQAINYLGTFKLSTLSLTVDGRTAAYF